MRGPGHSIVRAPRERDRAVNWDDGRWCPCRGGVFGSALGVGVTAAVAAAQGGCWERSEEWCSEQLTHSTQGTQIRDG